MALGPRRLRQRPYLLVSRLALVGAGVPLAVATEVPQCFVPYGASQQGGSGEVKVCTVDGCRIPISQSQDFCARCWNNVPVRYQKDFKDATTVLQRAQIYYASTITVIRQAAAKELEPR